MARRRVVGESLAGIRAIYGGWSVGLRAGARGADGNDGSEGRSLATINRGLSAARPGETAAVRAGTFPRASMGALER